MADKLDALQAQLATLRRKEEALRVKAIAELRARIAVIGATPEELFGSAKAKSTGKTAAKGNGASAPTGKKRGRPSNADKATTTKVVKAKKGVETTPSGRVKKQPTHRDPESGKTWNGMGPMPAWLKAHKKPDDLRI